MSDDGAKLSIRNHRRFVQHGPHIQRRLKGDECRLFLELLSRCDWGTGTGAHPGQQALMKALDMPLRTLQRAAAGLRAKGAMESDQGSTRGPDGTLIPGTNEYVLDPFFDTGPPPVAARSEQGKRDESAGRTGPPPQAGRSHQPEEDVSAGRTGPPPVADNQGALSTHEPSTNERAASSADAPAAAKCRRRAPATPLPDNWTPDDTHRDRAAKRGVDVEREAEAFRLHAAANDRRQVRWGAAFHQWLLNARPTMRPQRPEPPRQRHPKLEDQPLLPPDDFDPDAWLKEARPPTRHQHARGPRTAATAGGTTKANGRP